MPGPRLTRPRPPSATTLALRLEDLDVDRFVRMTRKVEGIEWLSFDDALFWQVFLFLGADHCPEGSRLLPPGSKFEIAGDGLIAQHLRRLRGRRP